MLSTQKSNQARQSRNKIKIITPIEKRKKSFDSEELQDFNQAFDTSSYSFNNNAKNNGEAFQKSKNKMNAHFLQSGDTNFKEYLQKQENGQKLISVGELSTKLQKNSFTTLQQFYGKSFSHNRQYIFNLSKIKYQQQFSKTLNYFINILIQIIQSQQQKRLSQELKNKQKVLKINKQARVKLRLTFSQENQKGNVKSFQAFARKAEEESQKYKRDYIQIKEKNRNIQSELLKLTLQFKNKRQLYLTEIARLTEILHSSFMEVGKMFFNPLQPHPVFNPMQSDYQDYKKRSFIKAVPDIYSRKNIKSLSPRKSQISSPGDNNNLNRQPNIKFSLINNTPKGEAGGRGSMYKNTQKTKRSVFNQKQSNQKGMDLNFDATSEPEISNKLKNSNQYQGFLSTVLSNR